MTLPTWLKQVPIKHGTFQYRIKIGREWLDLTSVSDLTGISRSTLRKRLNMATKSAHMPIDAFLSTDKLRIEPGANTLHATALRYAPARGQRAKPQPDVLRASGIPTLDVGTWPAFSLSEAVYWRIL